MRARWRPTAVRWAPHIRFDLSTHTPSQAHSCPHAVLTPFGLHRPLTWHRKRKLQGDRRRRNPMGKAHALPADALEPSLRPGGSERIGDTNGGTLALQALQILGIGPAVLGRPPVS